ncbi:MAG TPA: ABC transporter substrate-binding protein [Steroidobacteraceae bacterium]
MSMFKTLLVAAVLVAGAQAYAADAPAAAGQGPGEVVTTAAQGMLKELDADRATFKKDPAKVNALVEKYLLPHFDTEKAAQAVLGQHWRQANPDQRKRFIDAFYHSLLNNYGSALVDFTSDRLKIFPVKMDSNATTATVRTEVKRDNGDRIDVNYSMRKTADGSWKAWDVVISGISYVNSYRTDFDSQIDQQGLDSVIARLEKGEKPAEISKTTTGGGKKS